MSDPIVSHGRGGTGNIGHDPTPYTDGEIVREGPIHTPADGAYSTGRGGQGNIGSPGMKPVHRDSQEVIPEAAIRPSTENENYHIGRGGEGNFHHGKPEPEKNSAPQQQGLADKLKGMLFGGKKPQNNDGSTST
ncbi:MAG: hypothetical protein M1816_006418 [Peltula sp. TS41687]|nr:MAG: hypothetical protein M1816_006418 [Peltula sp. TS41687]